MATLMAARFAALVVVLAYGTLCQASQFAPGQGDGHCKHFVVQSLPEGLKLDDPPSSGIIPTHESLIELVEGAKKTLHIASFYWALSAQEEFAHLPSARPGRQLMEAILGAAKRGVQVEIVLDNSGRKDMSSPADIEALQRVATVKYLNMTRLHGSGVQHSKYLIADARHFYLGSSNFDWRSYEQIKEIGITFKNCFELAADLEKIFDTYSLMADQDEFPTDLDDNFKTTINLANPLVVNGQKFFLAGSPWQFNGLANSTNRTDDLVALLHVLDTAKHRVDISVMNYSPRMEYIFPRTHWPVIDNALRRAAIERQVQVRMLMSKWTSTKPLEKVWYKSLNALQAPELQGGSIHVKLFEVPALDEVQRSIPYSRVKHDKYMVTEDSLYVGTSNWTPDYFENSCGVGLVIEPSERLPSDEQQPIAEGVVRVMQDIFERDFNSIYAHELDE